jgi:hypothetical protein
VTWLLDVASSHAGLAAPYLWPNGKPKEKRESDHVTQVVDFHDSFGCFRCFFEQNEPEQIEIGKLCVLRDFSEDVGCVRVRKGA